MDSENTGVELKTPGERLRFWAIKNFKTVANLQRAMGASQTFLSGYVNNYTNIGKILQGRLEVLGCDIDWLMNGDANTQLPEVHRKELPESTDEVELLKDEIKKLTEKNILLVSDNNYLRTFIASFSSPYIQEKPVEDNLSLVDDFDKIVIEKIELEAQVKMLKSIIENSLNKSFRPTFELSDGTILDIDGRIVRPAKQSN